MAKLTLEEIGRMAGVSRSTVSRVINNQNSVSPQVRERVQRVIAETGFQPNLAARKLAGQTSRIIGLIIPETAQILFTDPYFPLLIQGISQACNGHDYLLTLFLFHRSDEEDKLGSRVLQHQLLDGVILTSTYLGDPIVEALLESQVPFISVGRCNDDRVSFIDADNEAGAIQAVSHLLRLGYRRVGTISGPMNNEAAVARLKGYRSALASHGVAEEAQLVVQGDYTEEGGYRAMQQLLLAEPQAVFVASDMMAVGALRAIKDAGKRVPHDVAVVGYDDAPLATRTIPQLTTIRQPIRQTGYLAATTLFDIIATGSHPPRRVVLPTALVVRESCGAMLHV